MKPKIRVRKNVSPAIAAAQLKTGLRHGEFARGRSIEPFINRSKTEPEQCNTEMAEIVVYRFIEKQFAANWDDAFGELTCLLQAIKHHPHLCSVIGALEKADMAAEVLNSFSQLGDKADKYDGQSTGYPPEHWQALIWFNRYFEDCRELPFKDVIENFWGFHGWIKGQTTFKKIADAIDDLINADCELREFVKTAKAR